MSAGMECGCSCYWDDYDPVICYDTKRVTVRKPHECRECGCEIKIGDQAWNETYLFEEHWHSEYMCVTCSRIRDTLMPCAPFGMLREELWECLGVDYVTGKTLNDED